MVKGRQRLRMIAGFRDSPPSLKRSPSDQDPLLQQGRGFLYDHLAEPEKTGLTTVLRVTEHRLNNLLEDRDRIGRDLHDCVLQSLYAIGLNLKASLREIPPQTAEAKQSGGQAVEQINHLIHEIRRMIRGLEEGTVQEFDLASELLTLRTTYEQAGSVQITLDLQPNAIEVLTKEEEQEILNIVREALSNCVRHANATQATVSIRVRGTRIRVSISDNGMGFLVADGKGRGYGLANMYARAKKLGGTLRVQSKIGRGTHIISEFSLEPILGSV